MRGSQSVVLEGVSKRGPIRGNQREPPRSIRKHDEGVDGDGVVGADDERVDLD